MDDKTLLEVAARAELNNLIREGLVEAIDGDRYRLTEAGRAYTEARYLCGPRQPAAAALGEGERGC